MTILHCLLLVFVVEGIKAAGVCSGPHVELLVSPVIEDGTKRRLTFDWEELPNNAEIGIFSSDPSSGSANPVFTYTPSTSSGWTNSTIEEDHIEYTQLGFKGRCLNHYIAYRTDSQWKGISCLRAEPTWMADLGNNIAGIRLKHLYLPGTHDSSAYKEYNFDKPDDPITKYSVTQDEPILGQLIYGARYIDLRPAYYPKNDEIWWGNHGVYQFHPMKEILGNLTEFLKNTNEIVILDAHEFPVGFDNADVHKQFIQYLKDTLGEYTASSPLNWDSTVSEVLSTNKRLIIGYNDGDMVSQYDFLWPAVNQKWGDKQHAEDLLQYLSEVLSSPPNEAWSAMAQLTPSALDIIVNTMKGLRHAAEIVNHDVTALFRKTSSADNTNILAIDFLRGSGAVRAAIEYNGGAGPCP